MQGVPAPNTGHKSNNDEANRLQELHQDGWTIRYRDYGAQGKPTRMELSYGALQIRLAIDSWKLAQRESMQRRS